MRNNPIFEYRIRETFSQNMKTARKLKGWTQQAASDKVGIKARTLASYEEGRAEPPHVVMLRICKAYSIDDLKSFLSDKNFYDLAHH